MRWPWRKKDIVPPPPEVETDLDQAKRALAEEEMKSEMVIKREEVVNVVARQARILRQRNHFADALRAAMGRHE